MPRAELPELAEGEYYLLDLIGLAVKTADGNVVGRVQDALDIRHRRRCAFGSRAGDVRSAAVAPVPRRIRLDERTVIVDHLEDFDHRARTLEASLCCFRS